MASIEKYNFYKYYNTMFHLTDGQRVRHIIPNNLYNRTEEDNKIWVGYYKNGKIHFNNETFYRLTDFAYSHYIFLYTSPLLSHIWKNQQNPDWYQCEFEVVEGDKSYWISTKYILEYHYETKFNSILDRLDRLENNKLV
jgi:hypothetical protein